MSEYLINLIIFFVYIGFGKFHYMLLAICGLIYMDTAIGVTIISFVLPAAQCDLQMDSTAKGWLTASPMLGEKKKQKNISKQLLK